MADMTQTELEGGQGPEGKLNTQSEKDPKSVVTLVYREGNPFMQGIAKGLTKRGLTVNLREVSYETTDELEELASGWQTIFNKWIPNPKDDRDRKNNDQITKDQNNNAPIKEKLGETFEKKVGDLEGVVVTDLTLGGGNMSVIYHLLGKKNYLSAYDALYANGMGNIEGIENLKEMVKPVIDELREAGVEPVVFDRGMADHLEFKYGNTEQDNLWETKEREHGNFSNVESFYTWFLKKAFNLRVASNLKTEPDQKTVFLVDHHLYNGYMGDKREPTGPEIVPVCPCCIGLQEKGYLKNLQDAGFRLYPLKYERVLTQTVDRLMGMIEQKRAELEAQKLSAIQQ